MTEKNEVNKPDELEAIYELSNTPALSFEEVQELSRQENAKKRQDILEAIDAHKQTGLYQTDDNRYQLSADIDGLILYYQSEDKLDSVYELLKDIKAAVEAAGYPKKKEDQSADFKKLVTYLKEQFNLFNVKAK